MGSWRGGAWLAVLAALVLADWAVVDAKRAHPTEIATDYFAREKAKNECGYQGVVDKQELKNTGLNHHMTQQLQRDPVNVEKINRLRDKYCGQAAKSGAAPRKLAPQGVVSTVTSNHGETVVTAELEAGEEVMLENQNLEIVRTAPEVIPGLHGNNLLAVWFAVGAAVGAVAIRKWLIHNGFTYMGQ